MDSTCNVPYMLKKPCRGCCTFSNVLGTIGYFSNVLGTIGYFPNDGCSYKQLPWPIFKLPLWLTWGLYACEKNYTVKLAPALTQNVFCMYLCVYVCVQECVCLCVCMYETARKKKQLVQTKVNTQFIWALFLPS